MIDNYAPSLITQEQSDNGSKVKLRLDECGYWHNYIIPVTFIDKAIRAGEVSRLSDRFRTDDEITDIRNRLLRGEK